MELGLSLTTIINTSIFVENYLWQGLVTEAIAEFEGLENKKAQNFQAYLRKHQGRIPDYQLYQELGICIGSGSVESWIKQIDERPRVILKDMRSGML